jgi:hypothetical protein
LTAAAGVTDAACHKRGRIAGVRFLPGLFPCANRRSPGLGVGFAPEWTTDIPNRTFAQEGEGIDFKIGLGIALRKEDPTACNDDMVEIAKSLVRRG